MAAMSVTATVTRVEPSIYNLSAKIVTDPPGRTESPALRRPRLAMSSVVNTRPRYLNSAI